MQGQPFYAGSGDGDQEEVFGQRWILNGSRGGSWNKIGPSRAPCRERVGTMRKTERRACPLGAEAPNPERRGESGCSSSKKHFDEQGTLGGCLEEKGLGFN